jgi:hypothetical protein
MQREKGVFADGYFYTIFSIELRHGNTMGIIASSAGAIIGLTFTTIYEEK